MDLVCSVQISHTPKTCGLNSALNFKPQYRLKRKAATTTKRERERESGTRVLELSQSMAHSVPGLCSPFFSSSHPKLKLLSPSLKPVRTQRHSPSLYPCIKALELDQDTVVALTVGFVSVAVGIGIPVFYETQIDSAAKRDNTQPCFPCSGSGAQQCRFCTGTGNVTVVLGGGETEVSKCINCEGAGSLTCTTCQGSGIQPRYLDRREFKDDD